MGHPHVDWVDLRIRGTIFRRLRERQGRTTVQIADAAGISRGTVSRLETGVVSGTAFTHRLYSGALGVPHDEVEKLVEGAWTIYADLLRIPGADKCNNEAADLAVAITMLSSKEKS